MGSLIRPSRGVANHVVQGRKVGFIYMGSLIRPSRGAATWVVHGRKVILAKVQRLHFHAESQRTQSLMSKVFLRDLRASA